MPLAGLWALAEMLSGGAGLDEPQRKPKRLAVGAWVTYDVANTIFWTGVVGVSFPLWITNDMSSDDGTLGYTLAATMTVVLLTAPILGAISDQAGRRMPMLVITTLVCVAATLFLGNTGLTSSLALFALAASSMELGTIFYNAMLYDVSTPGNRGKIAGMGQGIGYVGTFISVGTALLFTEHLGLSRVWVFRAVALLFLVFALPVFFLLREQGRQALPSSFPSMSIVLMGFSQLKGNLQRLRQFPGLRRFLVARFFYSVGINTAVAFAVVFASQTVGISDEKIYLILLAGTTIAVPSGVLWGILVDRIGPRPVLTMALIIWMGLLLFAIGIPWLSWSKHLWWAVGCLTGVAMAGIWTADRPYMLTFSPHQYLGEFFGLHGMVGKLGRVVGPFMWGFIAATLGLGQPVALLGLIACLVVSYVILMGIKTPVRSAPAPDLDPVE